MSLKVEFLGEKSRFKTILRLKINILWKILIIRWEKSQDGESLFLYYIPNVLTCNKLQFWRIAGFEFNADITYFPLRTIFKKNRFLSSDGEKDRL